MRFSSLGSQGLLASVISTALLSSTLVSFSAHASQYDMDQHIEFSYTIDCDNPSTYCTQTSPFQSQSVFAFESNTFETGSEPTVVNQFTLRSDKDWQYLKEQTYTILGLSVATVGFMTLLPESITKWDDESKSMSGLGQKWVDNVKAGPVWDKDEHFLNYVMHPYFGGVYYTAARHSGFNEFESFLYSFTMSTFFWEYGVEAFAEVPSWQDLFITPFFGALVGEMMFETEQEIVADGGEVLGSETMGTVSLFLLNPVGHIHYWVKDAWNGEADVTFSSNPWFGNQDAAAFALDAGANYDNQFYGAELTIKF